MASPLLVKYVSDFYGLSLLNQTNTLNKNSGKFDSAIDFIQNAGFLRLTQKPDIEPLDKEHPVIWSVTSEFAPIKEGGLGSVPPEIRNNAEKLGVNIPTFIPMYLNEGNSTFSEVEGEYTYTRGDKKFPLERAVTFKMDTFKEGKIQTVPVEIYLSEDKGDKGETRQLIFVKCDQYFDGTIYESSAKSEEPEKFAVLSKAIYELAKLKVEGARALKDVHIVSSSALDKIKEPDGMMLNDWQAAPTAALLRYKAPMENAYNQLSDKSADKLKNMKIATIGHNCAYQGSTASNNNSEQRKESTNNVLNTLFDKYTNDIVQNARTGASSINPRDIGLRNLDNALVMNYQNQDINSANFLNMGIVLSDFFLPVSKNYAKELINPDRNDLSGSVQWALTQKAGADRMIGIINGNDYKNLNIEAKAAQIKKTTGIDFELYNKNSNVDEVISSRLENKYKLYEEYMRPATNSKGVSPEMKAKVQNIASAIEFYKDKNNTSLPLIDKNTMDNTPVLSVVGRLVSQKGIDVAVDAIAKLYKNWDKEFPNCEKPIIYIAGMDNEGGKQRAKIEELKDKILSPEDSARVVFAHGFVPSNAIMAASDFFLMPSKFEPCGLTQGESMAVATPVIASAVGGIVDTVNRNSKHTGVLTDKNKTLNSDEFYKALVEGLNIYFNDKKEYQNMVMDSLSEDFSWIQKGKLGPVYDYLELFGISRDRLPDAA
ncbi:glycogen/starch synthase [bacterium]|nr:glycogen/starch synthase [bacterium]